MDRQADDIFTAQIKAAQAEEERKLKEEALEKKRAEAHERVAATHLERKRQNKRKMAELEATYRYLNPISTRF